MHLKPKGLSEDVTAKSVDLLKRHLTAAFNLHVQIKQAHWNVKSLGFNTLNEMFGKVAGEIAFQANRIDERAVVFGIVDNRGNGDSAKRFFLIPYPRGISDAQQYVYAIYGALAAFRQSIHFASGQALDFGDPLTARLFAEISSAVDGQLWMMESYLRAKQIP